MDHVEELVLGFGRNRDLAEKSGKESTIMCMYARASHYF